MKKRTCILFVFNGYADWEPALAIAGLQQFTDVEVKTFSLDGKAVKSMGNISVIADYGLADICIDNVALLILPGGNAWDEGKHAEILPLVENVLEKDLPLAAICGATSFLAQHGILDERHHTSNSLEYYLKNAAPDYRGHPYYQKVPCVNDKKVITANGTATVQFADAIFEVLHVRNEEHLQFWFQFFTNPEMVYS